MSPGHTQPPPHLTTRGIFERYNGVASARGNQQLRADFESKEIVDGKIGLGQMKFGIVYASILKIGEEVGVNLTELESPTR
jgi:hypothetical protein